MLDDRAPNEDRAGIEGTSESKLVAGSSQRYGVCSSRNIRASEMILQDRKRFAFANQLSILIADANSQNHLHPRGLATERSEILRRMQRPRLGLLTNASFYEFIVNFC
jgi:hypothetical protein